MIKVLILANSLNGLFNFRKELVEKMISENIKVYIAAPVNEKKIFFSDIGCEVYNTPMKRRSINLLNDIKLIKLYNELFEDIKPNIVLTYTIKPNIYGSLLCRLKKIPTLSTITGLGTSIESNNPISKIIVLLYRVAFKKSKIVFFQNESNRQFMVKKKIVCLNKTVLVNGSGVNLNQHVLEEYPLEKNMIKFIFVGRIMKAKGVEELFEAIKFIKDNNSSNVEFHILGDFEEEYEEYVTSLTEHNYIVYHGRRDDVHSYIKDCHALIHPSHHEGMSNVMLEAAASGRPVIASNISGCKEIFDNNITGLAIEPKTVKSLISAIYRFIELPHNNKREMGIKGRKKVETEFDRYDIVSKYFEVINDNLKKGDNKFNDSRNLK